MMSNEDRETHVSLIKEWVEKALEESDILINESIKYSNYDIEQAGYSRALRVLKKEVLDNVE